MVVCAFVLAFLFVSSWILHGVGCIFRVEAGWLDVSLAWKLFASLRLFFFILAIFLVFFSGMLLTLDVACLVSFFIRFLRGLG